MATILTNEPQGDVPDNRDPLPERKHEHEQLRREPGHSPLAWLLFAAAILLAAVIVYFVAYLPRQKRDQAIAQEANDRTTELPRIQVEKVKRAPATSELMVPGTTLAYTEAYIYARASGYLTKRYVDIGDRVREGQLLATIDAPDLDKQVAQARSALAQSESSLNQLEAQLKLAALTWDRWKVLVGRGVFSRQEGDQQEANYRVAEANVRAAQSTVQGNRDNLERLIVLQGYEQVRSPFTGVVTARNVDVGALISAQGSGLGVSSSPPTGGSSQAGSQGNNQGASGNLSSSATPATGGAQGGQMFTIVDINRLRVLVSTPEAYSSVIRVGQHARLFFREEPDQAIEAKVTRTSSSIDQNSRTLLVEIQVQNKTGRFLPGMYVVANFVEAKARPPLIVPGEAIVVRNAKNTVARVENNVIHFQPVSIGRDYGDQTEITGGISDGDVIATTITDEIRDGLQIDPQYPKPAQRAHGGAQSDKNPETSGQYGDQGLVNSAQKTNKGGGSGKNSGGKQGGSAGSGKQ